MGISDTPGNINHTGGIKLSQNRPNPFSNKTIINYILAKSGNVKINIYNVAGALVKNMVSEYKTQGTYSFCWDGRDELGRRLAGGTYLCRIESGGYGKTKKMVMIK